MAYGMEGQIGVLFSGILFIIFNYLLSKWGRFCSPFCVSSMLIQGSEAEIFFFRKLYELRVSPLCEYGAPTYICD
jgi:hypothetical protein